jgi:ATP-binding cassette subfamily B protein
MSENGIRPRSIVAGRERWEVDALKGQPELAAFVERLLAGERAISAVSVNPQTGRLLVHYDASARDGMAEAVRRAIRSGVEQAGPPASTDAPYSHTIAGDDQLRPRSVVPGRQRWEVGGLKGAPEPARLLALELAAAEGIRAVEANPLTGRLLVHHEPGLQSPVVADLIRAAVRAVLSQAQARLLPHIEDEPSRGDGGAQAVLLGTAALASGLAMGGAVVASSLAIGAGALVATAVIVRSSLQRSRWRPEPSLVRPPLGRRDGRHPLQRLLLLLGKEKRRFFVAVSLSVATKVLDVTPPLLIGFAVTLLIRGGSPVLARHGLSTAMSQIWFLAGVGVFIWVLESATQYGASRLWRELGQTVQHQLRIDTYAHVQRLPMEYFEDQRTGELASILSDDVNQLQLFVNNRAAEMAEVMTNLVVIAPIFYLLSPSLAWVAVVPIPLIVWWSFWYEDYTAPYYTATREAAGVLNSQVVNDVDGIATTKSFAAEEYEVERLRRLSDAYRQSNARPDMLASAFTPLVRMAVLLGFAGTIVVGGRQVVRGSLGPGRYASMISLTQRFVWPLTTLGHLVDDYQRAMSALARVLDARDLPLGPAGGDRALSASAVKGEIALERVSFAYRGHKPALRDVTLHLAPGQTVGIVGPTGAGKTTLVKLLLRFYDLDSGRIMLDGVDIREFRLRDLRDAIGFMSQDIFLFYGSIRDNIAYGSFDASDEDVTRAAGLAEVDGFILTLPDGYDTVIGERGVKLSGGQRQRISLARVILKDAPILILDEATASLDNETEIAIQRALRQFSKNRTTVAIAHRISTVRTADCIYVLGADGTIVERGRHDELLCRNGVYSGLWRFECGGDLLSKGTNANEDRAWRGP